VSSAMLFRAVGFAALSDQTVRRLTNSVRGLSSAHNAES